VNSQPLVDTPVEYKVQTVYSYVKLYNCSFKFECKDVIKVSLKTFVEYIGNV